MECVQDGLFSRYQTYLQMHKDKLQEEERKRSVEQEQEDELLRSLGTPSSRSLLVSKSNLVMFEAADVEGNIDITESQESKEQDEDDPLALFVPVDRRASSSFEVGYAL